MKNSHLPWSLALLLTLTAVPTQANTLRLHPIADATVSRPGGGTFDRVGFAHSLRDFDARGNRSTFIHRAPSIGGLPSSLAVYLAESGHLKKLAGEGTPTPDGSSTLKFLRSPRLLDDGVAFVSQSLSSNEAIYLESNGALAVLVDEAALGEPVNPFEVASAGNSLAFSNGWIQPQSIHLVDSGTISVVARIGSAAPGGGVFSDFRGLRLSADLVVFSAQTTVGEGLFAHFRTGSNPGLRVLVDQDSLLPGLNRTYSEPNVIGVWQAFDVQNATVAFVQADTGPSRKTDCVGGVFTWESGEVREVASNSDLDPTSGLPLQCFYDVYLFENDPWFRGSTFTRFGGGPGTPRPDYGAILRRASSGLERILGLGDNINGTRVFFYRPLLADHNRVVLFIGGQFAANRGLYEFNLINAGLAIPTLSQVSLIVFTALLLVVALRKM